MREDGGRNSCNTTIEQVTKNDKIGELFDFCLVSNYYTDDIARKHYYIVDTFILRTNSLEYIWLND